MPVYVALHSGDLALVDSDDLALISGYRWYTHRARNTTYARAMDGKKPIYMHRLISSAAQGVVVDHRNGDGLDNTKLNLRICTRKENSRSRHAGVRGISGFIGVGYLGTSKKPDGRRYPRSKPWYARVMVDRRYVLGGYFATAEEAAKKRDEMAIQYHGEFATLNFPRAANCA